jgi:hypothetical protein
MERNKLTNTLASLNPEEFLRFGKFLNSPYFNSSSININLYDYFKNFYQTFSNSDLTKENIFKAIYPEESYDDKKLRDRFTHMLRLLKMFLANEKYDENDIGYRRNLIAALSEKGLDNMIQEEFKSSLRFIEKMKFKDENYYLSKYLLEVSRREYDEMKISASQRDQLYANVKIEIDDAIHFFLIVMLKEYSIVSNTIRQVNVDHKFKFFEEIIKYLSTEEESYKNVVLIKVFYNFFQIYRVEHDRSLIYNIKDLLVCNRENLKDNIFKMLYIELYNHCKHRQSSGEKEFGKISFELMDDMLKREVFFREDGTMSAHTYINLSASGLRENNISWTENFIVEYKSKVRLEDRVNAYNYNQAVLNYMKGYGEEIHNKIYNYNIALGYLNQVKSEDFYYMTRIKNHTLKIFYELNHFDSAFSLIDSYYHYLSRNPIIPEHLVERYNNFITFLQRLMKLKLKPDLWCLEKLKSEINCNNKIAYKGWLLERIAEF